MTTDVLFLAHRIPFPPNKGDKIRSFHLLEYLSKRYRVHLGAFIDSKDDWQYVPKVQSYCVDSCFVHLTPFVSKIKSVTGLLSGKALTLPYYDSAELREWVQRTVTGQGIERILVFSSAMAQFVMGSSFSQTRRLIDFVDVDSDKWRQFAATKSWPLNWVYRREAKKLLQYEKVVADSFDTRLFVSAAEASVFSKLSGFPRSAVDYMSNGVDTEYFSPHNSYENPFQTGGLTLVFVGAMDYWANVEAVCWFVKDILPALKNRFAGIRFYIVGARPTDLVQRLARTPGVVVTGPVPDVRPFVRYASAVVIPLRIARGIQNKVLEAMAMAKPVVTTRQALEGIDAIPGKEVLVADSAEDFVQRLEDILRKDDLDIGTAARDKVCSEFNWTRNLEIVGRLLER